MGIDQTSKLGLAMSLQQIHVAFDVPAEIAQGLMNKTLERVGGVVRDSSNKQVVMWLQEGGSEVSKRLAMPPLAGGINALAVANPVLGAVNLGVSVAGFSLVLQQLNQLSNQIKAIEAKVDGVNRKLDDGWLAKLKAGINACQNAIELKDPGLRVQMAGSAINLLHEARDYFNRQAISSSNDAQAESVDYVMLAFVALSAEAQVHIQLDENQKAARTLRQGLDELRPGLIKLMQSVLNSTCHYLRPEFKEKVSLEMMAWLWSGFRRMQQPPEGVPKMMTTNELFDLVRGNIGGVFSSYEDWHGEIPQAVVDTRDVPDWYLGPINQGMDKSKRYGRVKARLENGLNKISILVETYDRICSECLQLEQMEKMSLTPSELKAMLELPQGKAAAVLLVDVEAAKQKA